MKVLLFANTEWYLYNFRLSLIKALRDKGYEVIILSPPGPYGQKLLDLGLEWIAAPMDRLSLNPVSEARLLVWLVRLLKREQIDLVHGFTIKCAVYGSIAARLAGVPARVSAVAGMGYVFTSDDVKARLLRPWVRLLMRLALNNSQSRLILQNPDDVGIFLRAGLVNEDRIRLIHGSGVDCVRFAPRQKPDDTKADAGGEPILPADLTDADQQINSVTEVNGVAGLTEPDGVGDCSGFNESSGPSEAMGSLEVESLGARLGHLGHYDDDSPDGAVEVTDGASTAIAASSSCTERRFRVLLPARLLWDKGVQEFVEADKIVKEAEQPVEFEFLLAGAPDLGNPASVPVDVIKGWVSEGVVQWLGHVDDMPTLFNSVDVVVLPSYREGLPKGLIEAGACGCPLITTDVPGCREVVTHEQDGLLVPVKDANALADAIIRLANDSALRAQLGQAARKKAVAQFDESIVIDKTLRVYRELGL